MRMLIVLVVAVGLLLSACNEQEPKASLNIAEKKIALSSKIPSKVTEKKSKQSPEKALDQAIDLSSYEQQPTEWGETVTGVKQRFQTTDKKLALTFDACGGPFGSGYDDRLIHYLTEHDIPATLFVNERWIFENEDKFMALAENPLFEIENHGTHHSPLSVSGGEAWGIPATNSPQEVYDEVMTNHETVLALIGKEMRFFRSGTAYYDEVAVQLANDLGYEVVNFDILGDAGATFSSNQVKNALLSAEEGSIVLLHMNQPESGTAAGVIEAIPLLKEQGYEFVLLKDEVLE